MDLRSALRRALPRPHRKDFRRAILRAVLLDFDGTLVDFVDSDMAAVPSLNAHLDLSVLFEGFVETAAEQVRAYHALADRREADSMRA